MSAPPPAPDARILWDVVEEHLDECDFLFEQWSMLLGSPLYTLDELSEGPEERLRAHLDGLAVGKEIVAERLSWPALMDDDAEPTRLAAAALALADSGSPWLERIVEELGRQSAGARKEAIVLALGASARADVSAKVVAAHERAPDAPGRDGWLRVIATRGGLPGPAIVRALADPDPPVRAAALRAARFAGRSVALSACEHFLFDPDPAVACAALEVGLVFGSPAAWSRVVGLASGRAPDPNTRDARVLAALVGERAIVEGLVAQLGQQDARADVVWALGHSGRVAAVEAVLPLLADDELGPLAGEAFAAITGLDRDDDRYWIDEAPAPDDDDDDDADLALEDDDLEANLAGTPEDDLPRPNAEAIATWWAQHRARFDPQSRYIAGYLAQGTAYAEALRRLSVRRRHALALEIAIRTRGAQHVPTRCFASLQRAHSISSAPAGPIDGQRPFARIS